MRAALADDYALDDRPADRAGLALAAIHPEMVLEIPAAVDPVYAGPVPPNALFQHLPDGHPKSPGLFDCDRIRWGQRVKFGQVQCFVGIYVTQPGQEGLIEQESS